jgi:hypothetical protein
MLRITIDNGTTETYFILEGSLAEPWVKELRNVVMSSDSTPDLISLNLTNVHFADEQGLSLLRELIAWGVALRAASPFIKELLKQIM